MRTLFSSWRSRLATAGLVGMALVQTGCAHPVVMEPSVAIQAHVGGPVYGQAYASVYGSPYGPAYGASYAYPPVVVAPARVWSPAPAVVMAPRVVVPAPIYAPMPRQGWRGEGRWHGHGHGWGGHR